MGGDLLSVADKADNLSENIMTLTRWIGGGIFALFALICVIGIVVCVLAGVINDYRQSRKDEARAIKKTIDDPIGSHPYFSGGKINDYRRDLKMSYRMKLAHDTSDDSFFQANVLVAFKHMVEAWEANEAAVKVDAPNAHGHYMHALNLIEENFGALEEGHRAQFQAAQLQVISRLRDTNAALNRKSELDLS